MAACQDAGMPFEDPTKWHDEAVRVVPHNPTWGASFEEEAELIRALIGPWITGGIHHVGSTAVPHLEAKPVIDIAVGVESLEASRPCIQLLGEIRYLHSPYRADVMHWFCKPDPARRTHHLHLIPTGSPRFNDELVFRDYLRNHPDLAAEYGALKRRLATEHPEDREAYTRAKGASSKR
jgi:GrpB-like predicted nucleotidyltransferase (UPF0157 family)